MKRLALLLSLLVSLPAFGQWPAWNETPRAPSDPVAAAQALAVPYMLGKSGIPFIGLSSGSVSSVGAITGITALPIAYPKAYCYFPANILATVKAAGWYYCTFSTTTAGTAFLDTYTSGAPTIPSSPSAVVDGKGAFTGDTGEEFGPTISVPAAAIGANGAIRTLLSLSHTATANNKTYRLRYSSSTGTILFAPVFGAGTPWQFTGMLSNRGVTNVQVYNSMGVGGTVTADKEAQVTAAIDTTAATTLVWSMQRATATDNAIIEQYSFELLSDGT